LILSKNRSTKIALLVEVPIGRRTDLAHVGSENADALRRRRMAFSSVRCSLLLARGSPLGAHRCRSRTSLSPLIFFARLIREPIHPPHRPGRGRMAFGGYGYCGRAWITALKLYHSVPDAISMLKRQTRITCMASMLAARCLCALMDMLHGAAAAIRLSQKQSCAHSCPWRSGGHNQSQ